MRDRPFALLLLAIGVALPAAALTPPMHTVDAAAQPPAARTLLPQDRGFVDAFFATGLAEIETGELAGRLASDPELRRLGSRLTADFAAANRRLAELLGPMRLAPLPDEPDAEHKAIADRLRESGAGDFDHLAHAVGKTRDQLLAIGLEVEELDHLLDLAAVFLLGPAHRGQEQNLLPELGGGVAVPAHQQVGQHRGVLEQLYVLKGAGDAEPGDLVRRDLGDVAALEEQLARGRVVEPRDQVEDRRLAGAVGADDGEDLALLDAEAHAVDCLEAAELQRDAVDREEAHRLRSDFT